MNPATIHVQFPSPTLLQAPTSDQLLTGAAAPSGTATAAAPGAGAPMGPAPQGPGFAFWLPLILVMVFFIFMSIMSARRDKKRRQTLLDSLKRGDKVLTVGGILGTIAELRDDELVLRIDENTNTKIRVVKTAIQQNLSGGSNPSPQVEVKVKNDTPEREKASV